MAKIARKIVQGGATGEGLSEAVTYIWQEAIHFRDGFFPDWWGATATVYNGRAFTMEPVDLPCGCIGRKYDVYPGFAKVMVIEAQTDREVFLLAMDICDMARTQGQQAPLQLEKFATDVASGSIKGPRPRGRPSVNFRRDLVLWTIKETLREKFNVHPTHREPNQLGTIPRSKTSDSASELIAHIFNEVGVPRHDVREETAMRTGANHRAARALERAFSTRSPEFHRLCEERQKVTAGPATS